MIVIVDYGTGNLGSVANMFRHLAIDAVVSSDPAAIGDADHLVLPGVGAYSRGMAGLNARGLVEPLVDAVSRRGVPLLGFCLGMQLLVEGSEEADDGVAGLGLIPGRCRRLSPEGGLRVPHMGWNRLRPQRPHPLVDDLDPRARFYFAHSYAVDTRPEHVVATTDYGGELTAVIASGNIVGTQFHPEKSHRFGMELLRRFAATDSPQARPATS